MYNNTDIDNSFMSSVAYSVLSNESLFYIEAVKMLKDYSKSCETFLNNRNINKLAFIGQATCCYYGGVPEIITKEVWKNLTPEQKNKANNVAKKVLKLYEKSNRQVYQKMEELGV